MPFGLPMQGLSSAAENNTIPQRRKYQSNEYIKDLGLNWMDFHARQYDPQIGRFLGVDPLAASGGQDMFSPYAAMGNAPESMVDPNGTAFGPIAFKAMGNLNLEELFGGNLDRTAGLLKGGVDRAEGVPDGGGGAGGGGGGESQGANGGTYGAFWNVVESAYQVTTGSGLIYYASASVNFDPKDGRRQGKGHESDQLTSELDGATDPSEGENRKKDEFTKAIGELFVNGEGKAAFSYNTKDNKGTVITTVGGVRLRYNINQDGSEINPDVIPNSGTPILDGSRWNEKGIYRVHNFLTLFGGTIALKPLLGKYTTDVMEAFNKGNGQAWYMGSSTRWFNKSYNVNTFRIYADITVQRVPTSIWVDIEIWKEK